MRNDILDLQTEMDMDIDDEILYISQKKLRKQRWKKKKRLNRIYTLVGMTGCVLLFVAIIYLGMSFFKKEEEPKAQDVLADVETVTYTQQELDEKLREVELKYANQAKQTADIVDTINTTNTTDTKAEEILNGIKQDLENGVSVVETLRTYYPNDIVLASGGEFHFVPIQETLQKNNYNEDCLNILENGEMEYVENGQVVSYKGIDVSKHQGEIDWQKVADDGVEFAFIRVGLRGYGTGKLVEDESFEQNIKDAISAGVKVGVYIYSQAINETEVLEEAQFVLDKIAPYKIECPVVFDVEMVAGADGRMNKLTVEERTNLTKLFCQTIENAGYKPMIYHNMEMAALKINMEELENYDKWFAYYNKNMYYPYQYDVWQYTEKGRVDGIEEEVDLNISFVPLWEE